MKSILFIFLLLSTVAAHSQYDQKKFSEIFEDEMDDEKYTTRTNHSSKYQYSPPQSIPSWFSNPPVADSGFVYAIGISDPGLDSTAAMDMAIYRAQVVANILRKSTTQLLCDFFMNEQSHSSSIAYEHYSRINAKMPISTHNFEVVDSYLNQFDEAIALIKYTPPSKVAPTEMQKIMFELYKNETESSIYGNYESVYEMIIKENLHSEKNYALYQLTEYGKRSDVLSEQDTLKGQVPIYTLAYSGLVSTDTVPFQYFTHGLWKEYFKSIMSFIIARAREKPEIVSVLADKYQTESYEKLTRGISVNHMRFVLSGIKAENNQLKVEMVELPLHRH